MVRATRDARTTRPHRRRRLPHAGRVSLLLLALASLPAVPARGQTPFLVMDIHDGVQDSGSNPASMVALGGDVLFRAGGPRPETCGERTARPQARSSW